VGGAEKEAVLMEFPIVHSKISAYNVTLKVADFIIPVPKLYVDNVLQKGNDNIYEFDYKLGNGVKLTLKFSLYDPIPVVFVDGEQVTIAPSPTMFECFWAGLPLVLIFFGGLVFAAPAVFVNYRILRRVKSIISKYLFSLLVSLGAAVLFLIMEGKFDILTKGIK
jgi:hypothetical protein